MSYSATAARLDKLQQELAQERAILECDGTSPLDPDVLLFGPQRSFVLDSARYKTAVCSRRAGKTMGCAFALVDSALRKPESVSMYLTLDRTDAKQIVWPAILNLNRTHNLGGKPNDSDLTLRLPNGSVVILHGAGDERKTKKRRGHKCGIVIVDEAQNFSELLQELVDQVIEPSLIDLDGAVWLVGTPGAVPIGYFYECTQSPEWSHHGWTFFDNPWIPIKNGGKTHTAVLGDVLRRRGVAVDEPSIQREFFGRWIHDVNSLVFRYSEALNDFASLPVTLTGNWWYCIGIDVGFDDADAIAVLAWNDADPRTWLTEEYVTTKQDITSLASKVREIYERLGPKKIRAMVMDTGGVGKKVAEELAARHKLPVQAAQKAEKQTHIELLNDALRTSHLMAKGSGRFARDAMLVEWDRDKSTPERRVVSDKYHSDIADAVLYAYRECLAWTSIVPVQPPRAGTPEWARAETRKMFERTQLEVQTKKHDKDADAWGIGAWDFGGGIEL